MINVPPLGMDTIETVPLTRLSRSFMLISVYLPGHAELPADFLQRPRMPVGEADPQMDDPLLTLGR